MDQKPSKITLLWDPSHVRVPGNKTADNEKYPPQDLKKLMKNKHQEHQQ
jgi:hypothetical protein